MNGYTYNNTGFMLEHISFGWQLSELRRFLLCLPVHLPHDAVITGLTTSIYDHHASKSGSVRLIRIGPCHRLGIHLDRHRLVTVGINSGFTSYSDTGNNQLVDNQTHAYYLLYWTPMEQASSEEIMLGGVQISYRENVVTKPNLLFAYWGGLHPLLTGKPIYKRRRSIRIRAGLVDRDFQAGVNLPNGARLDQLTFYYWGTTTKTVSANLAKVNINGVYSYVGGVTSALAAGNGSGSSTVFTSNEVNNNSFAYWLYYRFANGPKAYGVSIQYTPRYSSTDETLFSISAANFVPSHGNYTYQNTGGYIVHLSGGTGNVGAYNGAVCTPDWTAR